MIGLKRYLLEKDKWSETGEYLGNDDYPEEKHFKTKQTMFKPSKSNLKKKKPKIYEPIVNKVNTKNTDPLYQQKSGASAKERAKAMGLEYYGFGYWGRNDKVLYHTEGGELKPVNSKHYVVTAKTSHANKPGKSRYGTSIYKIPSSTNHDAFLKHAAEVEKKLSAKEKMVLSDYIGSSSGINGQLVDMAKGRFHADDVWNDFTPEIVHMDNIMKKSVVPTDTVVYRGIPSQSIAKKMAEELKNTNLIHMPTFLSTSFSPDAAQGFQHMNNYMIIKVPEGANALPVHYAGGKRKGFATEYEVILPRDSVLKLVRVDKRPMPAAYSKDSRESYGYRFIFELQ